MLCRNRLGSSRLFRAWATCLLAGPCNKPFSAPNLNVLVCLASLCVGHTNLRANTDTPLLHFTPPILPPTAWPPLALEIKVSYFTSKNGFIQEWQRNCNLGQGSYSESHRQIQQRRLFYREKGGHWEGSFWRKVHWRNVRVQGDDGFSLPELLR